MRLHARRNFRNIRSMSYQGFDISSALYIRILIAPLTASKSMSRNVDRHHHIFDS